MVGWAPPNSDSLYGGEGGVCAHVCAHVCARLRVCTRDQMCLQYTIKIFDQG